MDKQTSESSVFEAEIGEPRARLGFEQEWLGEEFVTQLEDHMARKEITRSALAKSLDKSPAYVTQTLRRGKNLTIRTMVEFAMAVEMRIGISLIPLSEMSLPQSADNRPVTIPKKRGTVQGNARAR